jgi:ABC-type nitrate/sulfonate/bicarbonate transport system substrate-binding protein
MRKFILFMMSLALVSLLLSACANNAAPTITPSESKEMVFMAGYKPQANLPFVGVYVAQEKGFFAEENLTVQIEHSPGGGQHLQLVSQGKVQVTTQDAAILLKRRSDPGLPLVSIALIGQKGQQAFVALKEKGFTSPTDWAGRLVGYKGAPPPELFALLKAAGADSSQIELVNVGFDPRILTEGKVDVYPVYKSNEPYMIQQWGYELDQWDTEDYGVPSLGLTYVTSEETLQNDPEVLRRFLRASLKGIQYAKEHPDEAVDIVLKYAGPETDRDHMAFMLKTELTDAENEDTNIHGIGWHNIEQWQALADMLVEFDAMQPTDVQAAFTNELLP